MGAAEPFTRGPRSKEGTTGAVREWVDRLDRAHPGAARPVSRRAGEQSPLGAGDDQGFVPCSTAGVADRVVPASEGLRDTVAWPSRPLHAGPSWSLFGLESSRGWPSVPGRHIAGVRSRPLGVASPLHGCETGAGGGSAGRTSPLGGGPRGGRLLHGESRRDGDLHRHPADGPNLRCSPGGPLRRDQRLPPHLGSLHSHERLGSGPLRTAERVRERGGPLHPGLGGLWAVGQPVSVHRRAGDPEHGRCHDGAGRPAGRAPQREEARTRPRHRHAGVAGTGGAHSRAAPGRAHHHPVELAMDLLPQRAARARGDGPLPGAHPRCTG